MGNLSCHGKHFVATFCTRDLSLTYSTYNGRYKNLAYDQQCSYKNWKNMFTDLNCGNKVFPLWDIATTNFLDCLCACSDSLLDIFSNFEVTLLICNWDNVSTLLWVGPIFCRSIVVALQLQSIKFWDHVIAVVPSFFLNMNPCQLS